jgi:hypothetical protein
LSRRRSGPPTRKLGKFDQAVAGSAPSASRSAARLSSRASSTGADGAAAAAAVETAIPERRHAASTSKLDAAARGSLDGTRWWRVRVGAVLPARIRTRE